TERSRNAAPPRSGHGAIGHGRTGSDSKRPAGEVAAIVLESRAEGAADLSRAAQQPRFRSPIAAAPHDLDSDKGLQGPKEHGASGAGKLRRDVQAVMHPIGEVDVGVAG